METKKAKQAVTLALDACGMRGRFTKRDVAEEAHQMIKWEGLSEGDRRAALIGYLVKEAGNQMKVPLRSEIKERFLANVPEQAFPILDRLNKTICVSPGGGPSPYYVLTLYASEEDWVGFLETIDVMQQKLTNAKSAARDAMALLKERNVGTIYELVTGTQVARQPFIGRVA